MPRFKFYFYDRVDSTNAKARELAESGKFNSVAAALSQTKGRGRFNRKWDSGLGGLYMTIVLEEKPEIVKYLTFIAALSVRKAIKNLGIDPRLKWPNDVLVDGRKICGILTETYSGKENFALIGIGLNVNQKAFSASKRNRPTSIFIETGRKYDIKELSRSIARNFNKYHGKMDYGKIVEEWKSYSDTLGKKVNVKTLGKAYSGKAADNDCNLIIKMENGKTMKIVEGDVFTIRPS